MPTFRIIVSFTIDAPTLRQAEINADREIDTLPPDAIVESVTELPSLAPSPKAPDTSAVCVSAGRPQFTSAFARDSKPFGKRRMPPPMPNGEAEACKVNCGHPACSHGCTGFDGRAQGWRYAG